MIRKIRQQKPSEPPVNSQQKRDSREVAGAAKHLQVLDVKTWRKRLLQLVGLFGVTHDEGVEVPGAPHLELDVRFGLHDLDRPGILSARREEEVLDFVNLLWLRDGKRSTCGEEGT